MNQSITVVIKPHHLIGNTYTHGGGNSRMCPVYEALDEQFNKPKRLVVASDYFIITDIDDSSINKYVIDLNIWNPDTCKQHIKRAENGDILGLTLICNLKT